MMTTWPVVTFFTLAHILQLHPRFGFPGDEREGWGVHTRIDVRIRRFSENKKTICELVDVGFGIFEKKYEVTRRNFYIFIFASFVRKFG